MYFIFIRRVRKRHTGRYVMRRLLLSKPQLSEKNCKTRNNAHGEIDLK